MNLSCDASSGRQERHDFMICFMNKTYLCLIKSFAKDCTNFDPTVILYMQERKSSRLTGQTDSRLSSSLQNVYISKDQCFDLSSVCSAYPTAIIMYLDTYVRIFSHCRPSYLAKKNLTWPKAIDYWTTLKICWEDSFKLCQGCDYWISTICMMNRFTNF